MLIETKDVTRMPNIFRRLRKMDYTPLVLLMLMAGMWAVLHAVTGIKALGSSAYNTYTLQALAWRDGHTWVENRLHLELAIFGGQYYVSFPPVPSVILWPLTVLFGEMTPDNLLVKLYALGACMLMYFTRKPPLYGIMRRCWPFS